MDQLINEYKQYDNNYTHTFELLKDTNISCINELFNFAVNNNLLYLIKFLYEVVKVEYDISILNVSNV